MWFLPVEPSGSLNSNESGQPAGEARPAAYPFPTIPWNEFLLFCNFFFILIGNSKTTKYEWDSHAIS